MVLINLYRKHLFKIISFSSLSLWIWTVIKTVTSKAYANMQTEFTLSKKNIHPDWYFCNCFERCLMARQSLNWDNPHCLGTGWLGPPYYKHEINVLPKSNDIHVLNKYLCILTKVCIKRGAGLGFSQFINNNAIPKPLRFGQDETSTQKLYTKYSKYLNIVIWDFWGNFIRLRR